MSVHFLLIQSSVPNKYILYKDYNESQLTPCVKCVCDKEVHNLYMFSIQGYNEQHR